MNDYFDDARYWLRRASLSLASSVRDDDDELLHDSVLFFAFGVEKVFKGILWNVNPLFTIEKPGFANACGVLYQDKMVQKQREKAEKDDKKNQFDRNVLAFGESMKRAMVFSSVVSTHIGVLTHLADLRGMLAHRLTKDMNKDEARSYLHRTFLPLVTALSKETGMQLPDWQIADKEVLEEANAREQHYFDFDNSMKRLIEKHLAVFVERKKDPGQLAKADRETQNALLINRSSPQQAYPAICPVCDSQALLVVTLNDQYAEREIDPEGYPTGFECRYCDFQIHDYEEMDYFAIQQFMP